MTLERVAGAGSFIVGLVARQLLDGMHYLCARQDHILFLVVITFTTEKRGVVLTFLS